MTMRKTTPIELNTVRMVFEQYGIRAMIAGGAVRDLILDVPTKDIDVFVPAETTVRALSNAFRSDPRVVYDNLVPPTTVDAEYERTPSLEIEGVFEFDFRGRPVQVCTLKDMPQKVSDLLWRMDFGICQAAWTGSTAEITNGFITDMRKQRFTLLRCGSVGEFMRSTRRHARLTAEGERYAGWPIDTTSHYRLRTQAEILERKVA